MIDIFSQFIKIRIFDPGKYVAESFHLVNIEDGIKAIIGKTNEDEISIQSYLFNKDKWNLDSARIWVKDRVNNSYSRAELLAKKHTIITSKTHLIANDPNAAKGSKISVPLTEELYQKLAKASLNDKYYFYVESVYEGTNLNFDHFSAEEMIKSYRSMGYQPVDWEHYRDQIIGFSLESQLVQAPEQPLAIGFNGILNRLSPYMLIDDRDETIRQRHFEGKLAMSMECYFDEMECLECGFRTKDFIEFEHHTYTTHMNLLNEGKRPARKLIGIDFVGNGIVETPAEPKAEIISLRTGDDGVLDPEIDPAFSNANMEIMKAKYGILASNMVEAQAFAKLVPDDMYMGNTSFASQIFSEKTEKIENNSTKIEENNDIDKEQDNNPNSSNLGGTSMFELSTKTAEAKSLSEVFVIAQTVLKEFTASNKIDEETSKAFSTELSEVVKAFVSKENFEITEVFTLSTEAHDKVLEDKKAEYETRLAETETRLNKTNEEKAALETKIAETEANLVNAEKKITELQASEQERAIEAKLNSFIDTVKSSGVALTATMEKTLRDLAKASVDDEVALKAMHDDLVAVVKQSNLSEASNVMGNLSSGGGNDDTSDLSKSFDNINKKFKNS